jgi:uncharacterized paraquat-inducible protein A
MTTTQDMVEFISLWSMLDQFVLSDHEDTIRWKWTFLQISISSIVPWIVLHL